jgi:hypothetical protein
LATLDGMLAGWRAEGWSSDDIEVWSVGYAGQEDRIEGLSESRGEESMFVDSTDPTASAIAAYDAHVNDLFVIDRSGCPSTMINLAIDPLTTTENREAFEDMVHGLL